LGEVGSRVVLVPGLASLVMDMPDLEASSSLVGLLKRGRGAGFLAALEADRTVARHAMLACICADQSWIFSSFDDRPSYYAALGLEIGLVLKPIRDFIRERSVRPETRDETEMACDVLGEMAKRGSVEAAAVLTDEVRNGPGWYWAFRALEDADYAVSHTPELSHRELIVDDALLEELSDRLKADPPQEEFSWLTLQAYPQLRWLAPGVDFDDPEPPERPDLSGWSVEELRTAALTRGPPAWEAARALCGLLSLEELRAAALTPGVNTPLAVEAARTLGGLGDLGIFDTVVGELEADPGDIGGGHFRKRGGDYLVALPTNRSLPLARRWVNEPFPRSLAADRIFEAHAEPADRTLIEGTVLAALEDRKYYRVWTLSGALKRLADPRSAKVMRTVFEESPYALARADALAGLVAIGGADADDLIIEALWDCYSGCRGVAVKNAPLAEWTTKRLEHIRDDPLEEQTDREAAAARLS
jgi:hypothetical protein